MAGDGAPAMPAVFRSRVSTEYVTPGRMSAAQLGAEPSDTVLDELGARLGALQRETQSRSFPAPGAGDDLHPPVEWQEFVSDVAQPVREAFGLPGPGAMQWAAAILSYPRSKDSDPTAVFTVSRPGLWSTDVVIPRSRTDFDATLRREIIAAVVEAAVLERFSVESYQNRERGEVAFDADASARRMSAQLGRVGAAFDRAAAPESATPGRVPQRRGL